MTKPRKLGRPRGQGAQRQLINTSVMKLLPTTDLPVDVSEIEKVEPRAVTFLRCLFSGLLVVDAISISGFSDQMYCDWLRLGGSKRSRTPVDDPQEPYKTFAAYLEVVLAAPRALAIANIMRAVYDGDVEASKWWLAKRYRSEFGDGSMVGVELKSPGGAKARVLVMANEDGTPIVGAQLSDAEQPPAHILDQKEVETLIALPDNGRTVEGYDGIVIESTEEIITAEEAWRNRCR